MWPAYLREAGYHTSNNSKKDYNAVEGAGVWTESSRQATWRDREPQQPFFHQRTFTTTHESSLHFPASDLNDRPAKTGHESVFVPPYHPDTEIFRYTIARYHDRVKQVDQQIGEIVDDLKADGLLENTFIFYFADHGGVLPRGKGYAYESGLHIPLVVRIPENYRQEIDLPVGSRTQGFVSFIDFGPTVLNLAGLEIPSEMDGKPFLGAGVSGEELASQAQAFGYADRFDEKWDLVRTIRKGRYKYVRSFQPFNFDGLQNNYRYRMVAYQEWRKLFQAGNLNKIQSQFYRSRAVEALYDLQSDPHETVNLADDPKFADVLADLRSRLGAWMREMPDLSMIPESVLIDEAMSNPVTYGQANRRRIAAAMDVADLSLMPFEKVESAIEDALESPDALLRYWACIVCSCHGDDASSLQSRVAELAKRDEDRLVRVRAAEYLGLINAVDPRPVIYDALRTTTSSVEAGLILNSVVMLRDGPTQIAFEIDESSLQNLKLTKGEDIVSRRLEYLNAK